MGNKKKKSRGFTEERSKTKDREPKNERKSNKSRSLKFFILVVVVVPVVAVIYSNEDYCQYISDVLQEGKVLLKSANRHEIDNRDVVTNDNANSKENFDSSQNQQFEETNHNEVSQDTSSELLETQGTLHTKENRKNEPPSQNIKTSTSDQNQIHDSKHLENKSHLRSDLKSECESKHGTASNFCTGAIETKDETHDSEKDTGLNKDSEFVEQVQSGSKTDTPSNEQERGSNSETHSVEEKSSSKMETSKSEKEKDKELEPTIKEVPYEKITITNQRDYQFREELDEADSLLDKDNTEEALRSFDRVLAKYPESPRAFYGKAETLDKMAEKQRSNSLLEEAIATFQKVLDIEDVPPELVIKAGNRLAERQQFRGWGGKAIRTLKLLCTRFPDNLDLKKKLGVGYLIIGQIEKSKQIFKEILALNPNDGFAKVHLGFIIKTSDNDPKSAIPFLKEGIESNEEGTQDGRFYFHLGDAYQRLQQSVEAYKLYERGAQKGLFLSAYQRSLYNVDHLTGRPWWKPSQTGYQTYLKMLEDNWRVIKEEGMAQLDTETGSFKPEEENLREKGDWKQFTLYQQGMKIKENCAKVPKTCELIDKIPDAKGCKRGQVKFSVMHPGVHVWPHCGPTNCRIRAHLGLVVPKGPRIRVGNTTRQWSVGKFIIFDDSFEHEVWHNGTDLRLVLIVDFWHPELSALEKRELTPI